MSAYDQTKGELCDKCGWAMKFPGEPCRCELERENAALRAISIEAMISNTAFRMKELERENARLRAALVEAINKRAETTEWRTDHPTTTGNPERWIRDELCIKWRAAIDATRKEAQP